MTYTFKVRNGDYVLNGRTGRPVRIRDKEKASQTVARMLGIQKPQGAGLDDLIGQVPEDPFSFSAQTQRAVRDAFSRTTTIETLFQLEERTDEERLSSIARMFVKPAQFQIGQISKTGYILNVDVLTIAGERVTETRNFIPAQGG